MRPVVPNTAAKGAVEAHRKATHLSERIGSLLQGVDFLSCRSVSRPGGLLQKSRVSQWDVTREPYIMLTVDEAASTSSELSC